MPLLTLSPSQSSPPVDAPDTPDSPPIGVRDYTSDTARLSSVGNLCGNSLAATNDKIFGF